MIPIWIGAMMAGPVVLAQRALETHVINRLAKRMRSAKLVTIDLDRSCDPAHGHQKFSLFHPHGHPHPHGRLET